MAIHGKFREWKIISRVEYVGTEVVYYNISFVRGRYEWYDEIRLDSHDRKHGRKALAPHFHLKVGTLFKVNPVRAVEEIEILIDNHLKGILGVIQK